MRVPNPSRERGASLIVVIIIIAFMLAVGVAILTVSGVSSRVSGSVREQEEAFDSAEAGFEAARMAIEQSLLNGAWANLGDNCLTTPAGIDLPNDAAYYRRRADLDLVQTLAEGTPGVLFKDHAFLKTAAGNDDMTRTFTVFLIEDDAGAAVPALSDVMMVCIGVVRAGSRVLATSRIEVLIGLDTGGNP